MKAKTSAGKTPAKRTSGNKRAAEESASARIDARIAELGGWRGEMLARVRGIVRQAVPGVVETVKWRGVPVWERDGIICTGETYKATVKLTFARGAALDDPCGLFNASLEGKTRRAIDLREGDRIDAKALKALVRAAVALNASRAPKRGRSGEGWQSRTVKLGS